MLAANGNLEAMKERDRNTLAAMEAEAAAAAEAAEAAAARALVGVWCAKVFGVFFLLSCGRFFYRKLCRVADRRSQVASLRGVRSPGRNPSKITFHGGEMYLLRY